MGEYTRLELDVTLKPEYVFLIETLNASRGEQPSSWGAVHSKAAELLLHPRHSDLIHSLEVWKTVGRCDFIPFGASAYHNDSKSFSELEGLRWSIDCSLKNYQNEIEQFLNTVLVHLVDEVQLVQTTFNGGWSPELWELDKETNVFKVLPVEVTNTTDESWWQ